MNFKKSGRLLIAFAAVIMLNAVSELPLAAEAVFLKDGSIVDGNIISDGAASVTIRMADKKTKQIPRSDIMRILYTELKMGKIYIQKRDGKGIVAYMVDEDRASYTFRMELYNPEEFTLKRSDVLFMAEKNPSGLQVDGVVGTDKVSLVWLPPYDAVKKYNVYIKKNEKDKYELIDSTGSKSITLKDLSSNTKYFLIVTSVDSDKYESSPSNELKITTKNIRPDKPVLVSNKKLDTGERKIQWDESSDPDGKVVKYRVYGIVNGKRDIVIELKKTEYNLLDASRYDKLEIAAVDDKGDESEAVSVLGNMVIGFCPGVIYPLGKFGKMFNMGYGGMFIFSERNLFFDNFEGGTSLGFYIMQGKDLLDDRNKDYQNFMIVPLYLTAGYNIGIGESFSIKPVLSFGGVYIDMKYVDRNKTEAEGRDSHLNTFEPAYKAGLSAEYKATDVLSVSVGCEYGAVIEESGQLSFITANAGINYSF